jgi:heme/copper-type cytochrome/quinol oxidase subunit 2
MIRLPSCAALVRQARASVRSGLEGAVLTAVAVALGGSSSVLACPMCFGAEEGALIDGAKLGILVMLAITFSVQGAFVGFFIYLRQRGKRMADADLDTEWSELQRGSRTS